MNVSEGSVSVGGVDVRRYDLETLRDAVAFVLQKNELFSGNHQGQPALGQTSTPPMRK